MSRKSVLIIIFIFFIIGIGFLAYYFLRPESTVDIQTADSEIKNPFGSFFPDENIPPTTSPNNVGVENVPSTIQVEQNIKRLRKISDVPIAGGIVFERAASSTIGSTTNTFFRYVERATGHIYEVASTSTEAIRISNTTIPKIYEAFFLEGNNQVVFRYLDKDSRIDTYVATVRATTTETGEIKTNLEGVFLQKDIATFTPSLDKKSIFTLSPNTNLLNLNRTIGQTALAANPNKQSAIFSSPLSSWTAKWFGTNSIALTSKPSYNSQGTLYYLNTKTGSQEKILGPLLGLSTNPNPNGRKVLYTKNESGLVKTNFLRVDDGISKKIPVATLAEKCVWSKDNINVYCAVPSSSLVGKFPDDWYMGLVFFNDSIVKIDTELETVTTIMSVGAQTNDSLDMIDLQLSAREDYLVFTNKRDLNFWSLDIKE